MAKQRIPLVGSPINRNQNALSFTAYDQRFTNCFPEISKNPASGEAAAYLIKRGGFTANNFAGASYVGLSGACVWAGFSTGPVPVQCWINGTTLAVHSTTTALGSTITNISGTPRLNETYITNGGTNEISYLTLVATKNTDNIPHCWFFTEGDASWTEITDTDFPPNQNGTATGSISGTTLTTSASSTGVNFPVGTFINGSGITVGTRITAIGTAAAGVGTYTVSVPQTTGAGITIYGGRIISGNMVHMDGYAFVIDTTGRIWNSDVNSLANWTSTSWLAAQSSSDAGTNLAVLKSVLIAFGSKSIEFFQNAGNATGSVLQRIPNSTVAIGCRSSGLNGCETVKVIGDAVYFVGVSGDTGAWGVYKITGTTVTKISNPAVDKTLGQAADNGNHRGIAGSMTLGGMQHILLYTGNSSDQFAYCIDTNFWWYFDPSVVTETCVGVNGGSYFSTSTNSTSQGRKRFFYSPAITSYQDNSLSITMTVQTQNIDHGTDNLKECTAFRLIGDTQTTSGNVGVSYSDNDYASFSSAKNIDMTQQQKKLDAGLGWFRRRAWKITETVNRPFRAQAFEVEFEVAEE